MSMENPAGQDLPQLLDLLTNAVVTLDAAGVDSYADVSLCVTARREGRSFGRLSIEDGRLSLETGDGNITTPRYLHTDHEGNRWALLLAELCYIMWHWRWEAEDVADFLGCGAALLERWIGQSQGFSVPTLPVAIARRVRRLAIIEQHRMILGIPDALVSDWLRHPREAFGGRSILDLLTNDGEPGFQRIELWLLHGAAAARGTVH